MQITILILAVLAIQFAQANHVSRIVGGTDAKPHSIPYQASVQKWDQHFCGGSILSNGMSFMHVKFIKNVLKKAFYSLGTNCRPLPL